MRAVGEHPRAADTAGISVVRTRYLCMIVASACAGFAGALLVLGQLGIFRDNVTAGRGFIALAIVIFDRSEPVRCLGLSICLWLNRSSGDVAAGFSDAHPASVPIDAPLFGNLHSYVRSHR